MVLTTLLRRASLFLLPLVLAAAAPSTHAQLASSFARIGYGMGGSFGQFAYDKEVKSIAVPQAQMAVTAPAVQINSVRLHLDQLRLLQGSNPDVLKVSVNGHWLPGGGRVAGDSGGGAAADDPFARWGVFVNGDYNDVKQSAIDSLTGFKTTTKGTTLGVDYRFANNSVLGLAMSYMRADSDLDNGTGNQNAKGWGLSIYGSFVPVENAYIDGIVNFGRNDYDGNRHDGALAFTNSTSGDQFGVAVSAGYAINRGALSLTPYARVEYVDVKIDGFTESGNSDLALKVGEQRIKATTLTIGAQASYAIGTTFGVLMPYGRLEYQYLAQSDAQDISVQVAADAASTPLSMQFLGDDKSFGTFAVGLTAMFQKGVSAFFQYQQLFGKDDLRSQVYTLGARVNF